MAERSFLTTVLCRSHSARLKLDRQKLGFFMSSSEVLDKPKIQFNGTTAMEKYILLWSFERDRKEKWSQGAVIHACNPSYSGSRPTWVKNLPRIHFDQ
jgi:hypothetical protein